MKLRPLPRSADTTGLTAGYGVIVRLDCTRNLRLLTHEFVQGRPSKSAGSLDYSRRSPRPKESGSPPALHLEGELL